MSFPESEIDRLDHSLEKLLPCLDASEIAIAGGVAIELSLLAAGLPGRRERIADLDLVARRREAISPKLAERFLVCHYHMPQPGYPKFLIMVVDPETRLRIDIFPDLAGSIEKACPLRLRGRQLLMLDPVSMLEHKLRTLSRASEATLVDEKHDLDALALASLCGRSILPVPAVHLGKEVYCTDLEQRCDRCEASREPAFPLAAKGEIFDLLGYI